MLLSLIGTRMLPVENELVVPGMLFTVTVPVAVLLPCAVSSLDVVPVTLTVLGPAVTPRATILSVLLVPAAMLPREQPTNWPSSSHAARYRREAQARDRGDVEERVSCDIAGRRHVTVSVVVSPREIVPGAGVTVTARSESAVDVAICA